MKYSIFGVVKRLLIITELILVSFLANAQNFTKYIGFSPDSMVYTEKLVLKTPAFKKNYFLVDYDVEIPVNKVMYYFDGVNFYLKNNLLGNSEFAKQVVLGKYISIYEYYVTTYNPGGYGLYGGFGGYYSTKVVQAYTYYDNPFRLKTMRIGNLSDDVSDYDPSLHHIKIARNLNFGIAACYVLGTLSFIAAIGEASNGNQINSTGFAIMGVAFFVVPLGLRVSKQNQMEKAIKEYNKQPSSNETQQ